MTHLIITVRFLDDRYHGLLDRGGPVEWPPSPFRLFQALVAGVARCGELVVGDDVPANKNFTPIGQALGWVQQQTREHPPIIIAPRHKVGQAITRFVPNNDGDKKFDRQERLTAKPTIPTLFLLEPGQKPEVHYLWDVTQKLDEARSHEQNLARAARSLTTLGWGIDMAFADARFAADDELQALRGVRWYPKRRDYPFKDTLRVPTYDDKLGECTLCDLRHCHSTFINRIEHGKPLKTVDKPKVFDRVLYTSVERPEARPHRVFKLIAPNGEDLARYPHAKLMHIAAMTRSLAIKRCLAAGMNSDFVSRFVRGKKDSPRNDHKQLSYVPLPSIGHAHADAMVRNVMLVAPIGMDDELSRVVRAIDGYLLTPERDEGESNCEAESVVPDNYRAELQSFNPPKGKFIANCYLASSLVWESVTPIILDEHVKKVDRMNAKTGEIEKVLNHDELICLALQRAGVETPCRFNWQSIPFLKNCLSAHRYDREKRPTGYYRPKRFDGKTAVHVRITFEHPIPGPIALGAGRHCGFGLMAAVPD
jgi:CRISPR-associated protein Csb2